MFTSYTIRRLEKATDTEFQAITAIASEGFKHDPFKIFLCKGDQNEMRKLNEIFLTAALLAAQIYVAEDLDSGKILGSISIFAPGRSLFGDDEQRAAGLNDFMQRVPPETVEWFSKEFYGRIMRESDAHLGEGAHEKYWTINSLAVDPAFRKRGIGRALLAIGEAMAQKDRSMLILKTFDLDMYIKWGYELVVDSEVEMPVDGRKEHIFELRKDFRTST